MKDSRKRRMSVVAKGNYDTLVFKILAFLYKRLKWKASAIASLFEEI